MLDQAGNVVVGPTFVERVFRPGRRSFLDHRLINYCNGLQVALLADDEDAGNVSIPDTPPDIVVESGVTFPRMNKCFPAIPLPFQPYLFAAHSCCLLLKTLLQIGCSAGGG